MSVPEVKSKNSLRPVDMPVFSPALLAYHPLIRDWGGVNNFDVDASHTQNTAFRYYQARENNVWIYVCLPSWLFCHLLASTS